MKSQPIAALQTKDRLVRDLTTLGVPEGSTLMVHSSLSALGWVLGGPSTVVRAVSRVLGDDGTLAMPAATPQVGAPETWVGPDVPEEWLPVIRDHQPVFDLRTTPTTLGAIPETFRRWPGTLRSDHPLESVCARGPRAEAIVREHPLAFSEGLGGPFERLYDLDAWILLLGVGFNRCTALHHAESRAPSRRVMRVRYPTGEGDQRVWHEVENVADDNDTLFPEVGCDYLAAKSPRQGNVGAASSVLFPMRELVDFATPWFEDRLRSS